MNGRILLSVALALPSLAGARAAAEEQLPPAATGKVEFARDIQPIFAGHCYACHGRKLQESNFRLDVRKTALAGGDYGEPAIMPGKSADSPVVRYAAGVDEDLLMPPKGKGKPLSAAQIGLLRAWIDAGAPWPDALAGEAEAKLTTDHWSLQPVARIAPPVLNDAWIANPIDAFILARLRAPGLSPSPPADRRTLIRRLYLDMHGLPPTPEQVKRFIENESPDAYAGLVDEVLGSPRYGERWARHWLDVVRFAETDGFEVNTERPNAYHYRDYVIAAFNEDKPYDQFVREQIAGDALGADAATGFLVGGPYDRVKSPDINLTLMQRQDELADMVNTTSTTFLAMTLGCARCHNHKFDPLLQKDYYAMQAVFAGVTHGERPLSGSPRDQKRIEELTTKVNALKQELGAFTPMPFTGRTVVLDDEAGEPSIELLAAKAGHGDNPAGASRGQRDDPGGPGRLPNVSGGRYTWWNNQTGQGVLAYRPAIEGEFRVWLSWGAGHASHTPNAQYVLDDDGDLSTQSDQHVVATVDQRRLAGDTADPTGQSLWSGFLDAGVHPFGANSRLLLRGGAEGGAVTADIVFLQEADENSPAPLQPQLRGPVNARHNVDRFASTPARFVRFEISSTNSSEPCLDELEIYATAADDGPARNVALASTGAVATSSGDYQGNPKHKLKHVNDGQYGNSRSWISNASGRGWVQIELPGAIQIDRVEWGRDREQAFQDRLAAQYVIQVATEPGQWRTVASSIDRAKDKDALGYRLANLKPDEAARAAQLIEELSPLEAALQSLSTLPRVFAGTFSQPAATHRLYRGDPMAQREVVAPDALTVLTSLELPVDAPEQKRRVELANWLASADNPLTARVVVNRLWHYHFGRGIVDTPSDFGANGSSPTHPELLDWLAGQLVDEGWSLKEIHRLILNSSTYRQSGAPRAEALAKDAGSRLLWRFPPRRIEAEAIRDSVLQITGVLDLKMGGPGYTVFQPNSNYVRNYEHKEQWGPSEWRRMIYMTKIRMERDGVFGAFDSPDAGQVCPKRSRSTTALQALNLLNSRFMLQQSELLAGRLQREAGDKPADQVNRAFQLTTGRNADPVEQQAAQALIAGHGLPAFCRAMLNANEFLFIP
jgi:mono/diheme cytochrome c family protein